MKNKTLPPAPKFSQLSLYLKPYIPEKKLKGALASYVVDDDVGEDDILLLVDDTVFGSAKEGFVFTDKRFFYKGSNNTCGYGSVSNIKSIEVEPGIISHDIYFEDKEDGDEWWSFSLVQARANDIKLLKKYLTEIVEQLQTENIEEVEVDEEIVEQAQNEQVQFDEEQLRLEIRKQLILEEEKRKLEEEQRRKAQQGAIEIEQNSLPPVVQTAPVSQKIVKSRYIGTRVDDDGSPEPRYLGESIEVSEFMGNNIPLVDTSQNSQSNPLFVFLQNNGDNVIAKLKDSGLSLTASALQNDENIIRIAGFVYNFLPMPVRIFVNIDTIEQFLMNNRQWLINKLS